MHKMQMCDQASLEDIKDITAQIADSFQAAALQSKPKKNLHTTQQNACSKPWFGRECKTARRNHYLAKRIHRNDKSDVNEENLLTASKQCKKTMNKYINKYTKPKYNKLQYMSTHEPKKYWNFLTASNEIIKLKLRMLMIFWTL